MSNNIIPIVPEPIRDPRVNVDSDYQYSVLVGGQNINYRSFVASGPSQNSVTFNCNPPAGVIVDRKVYLRMPITITFTGTAPVGQNLLQSGYDAFRQFPLTSIIQSINLNLNSANVVLVPYDIIHALMKYNNCVDLFNREYSQSPSMPDQSQTYDQLVNTVRNPLAQFGDNSSYVPRGAFPITVVSNTNTSAQITAVLVEPLFISPLYFGQGDVQGLTGLQTIDITIDFINRLSRIWSHSNAGGSVLSDVSVSLGLPSLLFCHIQPKEVQMIPKQQSTPYYQLVRYSNRLGSPLASGATTTFTANNIDLNSIPRRLYIFVKEAETNQTFTSTDSFLSITKCIVYWNSRNLLTTASEEDLYNICKRNGCMLSFNEWSARGMPVMVGGSTTTINGIGSVIALDVGIDIGLESYEGSGINGKYQLQLTLDIVNRSPNTIIDPTIYVLAVNVGTLTNMDGFFSTQVGILSQSDALSANTRDYVNVVEIDKYYGGNFFTGLKDFAKDFWKGVKKVAPYVQTALPYVEKGLEVGLPLLAGGEVGGCSMKAQPNFYGGRKLSKQQMINRLK